MKVLVLGGTGFVGRQIVRRLHEAGDEVIFTWFSDEAGVASLPGRPMHVDLSEPGAAVALMRRLSDDGVVLDGLVHCARLRPEQGPARDEAALMAASLCLSAEAIRASVRALALRGDGVRNVVLLCSWSPGQSLPMAAPAAAAQGAIVTLAMALGRELAGQGILVNAISLGLLDGGAAGAVPPEQVETYTRFSALHRTGRADEVAKTALWLLRDNRVLNGKVLASNGGI